MQPAWVFRSIKRKLDIQECLQIENWKGKSEAIYISKNF